MKCKYAREFGPDYKPLCEKFKHLVVCNPERMGCNEPLIQQIAELQEENAELRKLCRELRTILKDIDYTPYVTERPGKNPAVTWLEPDWEPIEECDEAMKRLGIEVSD